MFRYKVLSGRARRISREMPLSEDSLLKGADTIFAEKGCGRCTVEEWFHIALGWCTSLNTAVVSDFFEGEERVAAMGVQAASVGAGMTLLSALSGILGKNGFRGLLLHQSGGLPMFCRDCAVPAGYRLGKGDGEREGWHHRQGTGSLLKWCLELESHVSFLGHIIRILSTFLYVRMS